MTQLSVAPERLTERAVLATLTIREWRGRRHDKEVTAQVARDHGASRDAGCYTKALLPKSYLSPIAQVRSEARACHYELTLPWTDEGSRILPVDLHLTYMERVSGLRTRFAAAVSEFLAAYAEAKAKAREVLGSLYREADYPSCEQLKGAFELSFSFLPLPTVHDWRIDLPEATVDHIRLDLETKVHDAHRLAMADLYGRLAAVVTHMAETLAEPDKIFRDSLVGNVQDLCSLLPHLNIARDEDLASLTRDIEARLARLQPALLRRDAAIRQVAAVDAAALLETIHDRLASYTGAS